jgi:predicted enzyme related to lactoylglutathione lyase
MRSEIVTHFVNAINLHDYSAMSLLMSDTHRLFDTRGNEFSEKESVKAVWEAYFKHAPDYKIAVEKQVHHGSTIALFGIVSATLNPLNSEESPANWEFPAAWKVLVEEGKITHWQIFADDTLDKIRFENSTKKNKAEKLKVEGFGGVFFKSKDPKKLTEWYDTHLGTSFNGNTYSTFKWRERENYQQIGRTEFSVFKQDSTYFAPSEKPFMFNFRVTNLDAFLEKLRAAKVHVEDKVENYDYGKFAWILDLEGNKIELWEPIDAVLEEFEKINP